VLKNMEVELLFPGLTMPHAFRCPFFNRDADYQQDERIVLLDGYSINGEDAWGNTASWALSASAVNVGGGIVGLPCTGHGFVTGMEVLISGTTNYDGTYRVLSSTTENQLQIVAVYVAETFGENAAAAYPPATKFEELRLEGVTDAEMIFKLARYHGAVAQLRSRRITADVDLQHLVCTRGDLVELAHDVIMSGLAYGRVKELLLEIIGYEYDSQYPPEHSDTYVKATSKYSTDFWPYFATDPAKSVTGSYADNAWISADGSPSQQRIHLDLGSAKTIDRIYYANLHDSGTMVTGGVQNFTLWGSNDPEAFADLEYGHDTGWTQLTTEESFFDEHVADDVADWKSIGVTGAAAYRYYAFKCADNYGHATLMGMRRLELQTQGDPIYSNLIAGVGVDELCPMQEGETYLIQFRVPGEVPFSCQVVTEAGEQNELTFETPLDPADTNLAVGDLFTFGGSIRAVVADIKRKSNFEATLTFMDEAPGIHEADQGTIPAHDSQIITPAEWWTPQIGWIRSDGTVLWRDADGSWKSRILVTLIVLVGLNSEIIGVEAQYWPTDSNAYPVTLPVAPTGDFEISILPVEDGISYDFRLRYVKKDGGRGPWTATQTHVVEGKTAPPENVIGFNIYQVRELINFIWTANPDLDIASYELRYGATGVSWAASTLITETTLTTNFTTPLLPPGSWDFLIKAIDTSGNYSETATRKTFRVMQFYQVLAEPLSFRLWEGTITNMVYDPLTGWLFPEDQDIPSGNDFDVFDNFVVNPYATYGYEAPEIDLGEDMAVRAWARIYSELGPGETPGDEPELQLDYREDAGSYDGFETWTIGPFLGRYAKFKTVITAAEGNRVLKEFQPVMDKVY